MKIKEKLFGLLAPTPAFILFLAVFIGLLIKIDNYDFIWHLFLGKYIAIHKLIPDINLFYYTPSVFYGYDQAWLSQIIFYLLYSYCGGAGLIFFNAFLGGVIFFLLYKIIEHKSKNFLFNTIFLILVSIALLPYLFSFRPLIFTLFFFTVFLTIFDKYQTQRGNSIYLLPFLIAIWVNLHPGYLSGIILFVYFVILNFRESRKLIGIFVLSLLALLCNPYFYKVYTFPVIFLKSFNLLRKVSEWGVYSRRDLLVFAALVLLCIASFIKSKISLRYFTLFGIFFILALIIERNIPFFAIISVIIIREFDFAQLFRGKIRDFINHFNLKSSYFQGWLFILIIGLALLLLSYLPRGKSMLKYQVDFSNYPIHAVHLIKELHPEGNVFSWEGWSGYLLWELYPSYKMFFDAKGGFGEKQLNDYIEIMKPRVNWCSTLDFYNIKTVLMPKDKPINLLLESSAQWQSIYSDTLADLFIRK